MLACCSFGGLINKSRGKGLIDKPPKKKGCGASVMAKSMRTTRYDKLRRKIELAASNLTNETDGLSFDFCIIHHEKFTHSNNSLETPLSTSSLVSSTADILNNSDINQALPTFNAVNKGGRRTIFRHKPS